MNFIVVLVLSVVLSLNSACKSDKESIKTGEEKAIVEKVKETKITDPKILEIDSKEENLEKAITSDVETQNHSDTKQFVSKTPAKAKELETVTDKKKALEEEPIRRKPEEKTQIEAPVNKVVEEKLIEVDDEIENAPKVEDEIVEEEIKLSEEIIDESQLEPKEIGTYDMHDEWNKLLRQYVTKSGKVDYVGIKKERNRLDGYIAVLANNPPAEDWSRDKKLAYWINVYNAYTVLLIVNNYPVKSIMDLEGGKPWDKAFVKVGGTRYTLNQVENEIIRPRFKEPRIHFAVNCAAKSCPPLANQAFTEENLEALLIKQTTSFVKNAAHNKISAKGLTLSKIFEWYKSDFPDLIKFISKYSGQNLSSDVGLNYGEYDWTLNGQ